MVLALSYTDLTNRTMLIKYTNYVNNLAKLYGFIPYVTEISLTKINPLNLEKEAEKEIVRTKTSVRTMIISLSKTETSKTVKESIKPLKVGETHTTTETKSTPPSNTMICMLVALIIVLTGIIVVSLIKLKRE